MRALFSQPASIAIADESLAHDGALGAAGVPPAVDGLEIVPAWQARPPRRRRRLSAAVPLVAIVAAAALWVGRGDDARALREPAAVGSVRAPTHALVVSAASARRAGSGRSEQ